ncbi:MAG: STAS domain-containing protein [Clostridia bacterium]|nr:STAS domain-containing protein [Clostridia bacterium]
MKITKHSAGTALEIALEGRLDTNTAPELEKELKESLGGVTDLTLDFAKLEYISSAGLRVLLSAHKTMQGRMTVKNVNDIVNEVFDVTGFVDILNIE